MGYKIAEAPLAAQDIAEILEYMIVSLNNPTAAAAFADELERCYDRLERMPMMYEACRDVRLRAMGYRKAVVQRYVLIYKLSEEEKTVSILRVFYGRQNYAETL